MGADNQRNLCASGLEGDGDVDAVLSDCDIVMKETFHVKAVQQTMMETFRTATYLDTYGRINVFSSTQIPFHVRRIIANALDIPKSKVRVIKPRIGGGFGAKQTVRSRSVSSDRHNEDRKTGENDFHKKRVPDCIFPTPRDGSYRDNRS